MTIVSSPSPDRLAAAIAEARAGGGKLRLAGDEGAAISAARELETANEEEAEAARRR